MDKKIEEGLWFEYSHFIYGIKADEDLFQELLEDVKNNGGLSKDEGSKLFWLHHDWDSLDGWWLGDEDNPKGLVIGTNLSHWLEGMEDDDFIPEELDDALIEVKKYWNDFGQFDGIIEHFELHGDFKPTLNLITNRYFLSKKEIEEKYNLYPSIYPQYKDYLEADCWEIREII